MINHLLSSAANYWQGLLPEGAATAEHAHMRTLSAYVANDDAAGITAMLSTPEAIACTVRGLQQSGYSPLHQAAANRKDQALQAMLEHLPIDVWILRTEASGRTAFMLAMEHGNDALVFALKSRLMSCLNLGPQSSHAQVDVDVLQRLEIAFDCELDPENALPIIWGLLVNARDQEGNTALLLALKNQHYLCCRDLLFRNADVDAENKQEESARRLALDLPATLDLRHLLWGAPSQ
jgi:ankyrin repeat protein